MDDPDLARSLRRCAEICDQALGDLYDADPHGSPVTRAVMLAVAAFQTAADADDRQRDTKLLIAGTLAREALTAVRASGLDEATMRCTEALDRAAYLCERAIEREG